MAPRCSARVTLCLVASFGTDTVIQAANTTFTNRRQERVVVQMLFPEAENGRRNATLKTGESITEQSNASFKWRWLFTTETEAPDAAPWCDVMPGATVEIDKSPALAACHVTKP